jgi:hypothetical protein
MLVKQLNSFLKLTLLLVVGHLYGQTTSILYIEDGAVLFITTGSNVSVQNGFTIKADAVVFFMNTDNEAVFKNNPPRKIKIKTIPKELLSKTATKKNMLKGSEIQVASLPFRNPFNNTNNPLLGKKGICPTTLIIKSSKKFPEIKAAPLTQHLMQEVALRANNISLFTYKFFFNKAGKVAYHTVRPPPYSLV